MHVPDNRTLNEPDLPRLSETLVVVVKMPIEGPIYAMIMPIMERNYNLKGVIMTSPMWVNEFPDAVTVCAQDGTILEMNDRAAESFKDDGGRALIGKALLDCHPEKAREKVALLLASHQKNVYTIEKKGVKKLIYQSPWYENGEYRGMVELSLELPAEIPHFRRD